MRFNGSACHLLMLLLLLGILFIVAGCGNTSPGVQVRRPDRPIIYRYTLSAKQGLRDIRGDITVGKGGADTGIRLLPGEKVELFADGSARTSTDGQITGPEGKPGCRRPTMPEPSLSCYSVIYSVGAVGRAGEVGTHAEFIPSAVGNLFLGVNAPNLQGNAGAFQLTIVIIPVGTVAGLWTAPQSNFTLQGTSVTLSARAFAYSNPIQRLQFTATLPGGQSVPICDATTVDGMNYSCQWDETLQNGYLPNGSITFGFTIEGSHGQSEVNPDGVRLGIIRYVITQTSNIYAGYAATSLSQPASYKSVSAQWTVPQANCAPGETSLSAIWVGLTGISDKSVLAQIATESDCQSGVPQYAAVWEMFPAPTVPIPRSLSVGDTVVASVAFQQGAFQLTMRDVQAGWRFSTTQPGNAADTRIAECIAEAPTLEDPITHASSVAQLTDFGAVRISCHLNGNGAIGDGPQDIQYQMNTPTARATTSALDHGGAVFTVQWEGKGS